MTDYRRDIDEKNLWETIVQEARIVAEKSPLLADFYQRTILQHQRFDHALAYILAEKLTDKAESIQAWQQFLLQKLDLHEEIFASSMNDLLCQLRANASIKDHFTPLLYFGGYQALQCYRFAHRCWHGDEQAMASYIQSRIVSLYGVDIHPAAVIGNGIFIDHAVGIVIGETAVIENNVTLFQGVTLGGTGKGSGDRHPKVRTGAFIGAGAAIFGNIEIGENSKIGGGAVVVNPVAANSTVVGPLARSVTS